METQQIRRRANGTIDIDSYREDALVLRTEATRRAFGKARHLLWPLIGVVAVVSYAAVVPRTPAAPSIGSMLVSAGIATTSSN